MNHLIKQFTLLFLMYSIIVPHSIKTMERINNSVTVINENNDPLSLLQLVYTEKEVVTAKTCRLVGMTTIMNAPTELKCRIANSYKDGHSSLKIADPRTRQKRIKLKTFDKDIITIHAKNDNNVVVIRKNGDIIDSFKY